MPAQLERLRADLKQVDQFIQKLQQRGDMDRVRKLQAKRAFLTQAVSSLGAECEYAHV